MPGKPHTGALYRGDLLWCLHAAPAERHDEIAELLGFIDSTKPTARKIVGNVKVNITVNAELSFQPSQIPPPATEKTNAPQLPAYYRLIDRKIREDHRPRPDRESGLPDWYTYAQVIDFNETASRVPAMHRLQPVYTPLTPWSRLLPLLLRVLGRHAPGGKPDIDKLIKQVSLGRQISKLPKRNRHTWADSIRLLIDINAGNFPYRQDFLRLYAQLLTWRGGDGLQVQFIHDEPGGKVCRYPDGEEVIEPWTHPGADTPLLILSDLSLHNPSRRGLYQWLAFGQRLNLNGVRATVLLPVAARNLDSRLLNYFDCIAWDSVSDLKPVRDIPVAESETSPAGNGVEKLLALLFPALRVDLSLLRAVRRLLPAKVADVSDEAAVWRHAAVLADGDEWGWQAGSRAAYQEDFVREYKALDNHGRQQLLEYIGVHHAQLPDELYFEAMHQFIRLNINVPEPVREATLAFLSMLVKTYRQNPDCQGLDAWAKRFLAKHDAPALRSEHQLALLAIEKYHNHRRTGLPIEWPEDVDPSSLTPFLEADAANGFFVLRQTGAALELLFVDNLSALVNDWHAKPNCSFALETVISSIDLRYPDNEGRHRQLTLSPSDLPYKFALPVGERQLHIGEESITVEAAPINAKPDWVHAQGMDAEGLFRETLSGEGQIYRWYWHAPEIIRQFAFAERKNQEITRVIAPGFWHYMPVNTEIDLIPDWAAQAGRDQYGLYTDAEIAGVTQRFRWIQPGSFDMGSPKGEKGRYDEEVRHRVILSRGYWLADTACTQALWQAVMGDNPSSFKGESLPVENVSWEDVHEFLRILNQRHTYLQLRLPTEAEWEYACRAGTEEAFNFGDEPALEKINYRGTWDDWEKWGDGALQQTTEVKTYPANAWGLFEMHGNVWEWCQDWYGEYPAGTVTDPQGPDKGDDRVLRGGSWSSFGVYCRSADRSFRLPSGARDYFGFRLVRDHKSGHSGTGAGRQPAVPPDQAGKPGARNKNA